jgi:ubiquinone/menaquinone biosynthesis C-methylase UbiE
VQVQGIMMKWFRPAQIDPLAVSMSGVKLGDRLLVVGCSDPALIAALATKAGLTGRACAVDDDGDSVVEAARVVQREGALIETARSTDGALPFEDASFDVVVLRSVLPAASKENRATRAAEALRVLRPGGRCMVVDGSTRSGLSALFGGSSGVEQYRAEGGAQAALQASGFAAVRTLAEREGVSFVEGVKRNT